MLTQYQIYFWKKTDALHYNKVTPQDTIALSFIEVSFGKNHALRCMKVTFQNNFALFSWYKL